MKNDDEVNGISLAGCDSQNQGRTTFEREKNASNAWDENENEGE